MKIRLYPIAVALLLGLAACVTEYSKSEAPAALRVDGAESRVELAFASGSDRLAPGEARQLDRLVLAGNIRPADRVAIAAAGPPRLAERRAAAISSELLRYGIVAQTLVLDTVPANRAIVSVGRYAVTLPACPNWSQSLAVRVHQRAVEQLRLRQCDKSRPDGGEPRRPRQRPHARTGRRPARRRRCRALYERSGQASRPTPTASPFAASTGGGGEAGGGGAAGGAGAGGVGAGAQ